MDAREREDLLVRSYGEVCGFAAAGRILSRDPSTIKKMAREGRLEYACEGTRVDVRSIARYICAPKQIDSDTRLMRRRERDGIECKWKV